MFGRTLMTAEEYRTPSNRDLMLDNGETVTVSADKAHVRCGCVTLTWAAWDALKAKVAQLESVR